MMVDWFKDDKSRLPGINELKMIAQGIIYEYNTCDRIVAGYTVTHLKEILKNAFTASSVDDFISVEYEDDEGKMSAASTSNSEYDSGEEEQWVTFEGYHFCNVFSKVVVKRTGVIVSFLDWIWLQSDFEVYVNEM